MATLYITEQGARIRREHGRLLVQLHGTTRREVLLRDLERVVLFGAVELTSGALDALFEVGADVAYLTRGGRLKGRLVGTDSKNVLLRLDQYDRFRDGPWRLRLAKALVDGKIGNARRLISRHHAEHGAAGRAEVLEQLEAVRRKARAAHDVDSIRGHEGHAAALYFGAFGDLLRGDLAFERRRRRPPPDPVNALLGFGYTLVGTELAGVLSAVGFDAHLGYLHEPRYGRLSLAQDLLDEFRSAAVDRLVLTIANRRMLGPDDFEPGEEGGVRMTRGGLRVFLEAYEAHLTRTFQRDGRQVTLRRCFVLQAQALARAVKQDETYRPHRYR